MSYWNRFNHITVAVAFDRHADGCKLEHVHVCGVSIDVVQATLNMAIAASHTPTEPSSAASAILRSLEAEQKSALGARAAPFVDAVLKRKGSYHQQVLTGEVSSMISNYAHEVAANAVIFGRHKFIHTGPFFMGRMPLKAMLAVGCPLIVVPSESATA